MRKYLNTKTCFINESIKPQESIDLHFESTKIFFGSKLNPSNHDRYSLGGYAGNLIFARGLETYENRNIRIALKHAESAYAPPYPVRNDGAPQLSHPLHVFSMAILIDTFFELRTDVVILSIAAALHDMLEDCLDFYTKEYLFSIRPGLRFCRPEEINAPPDDTVEYFLNKTSITTKLEYCRIYINEYFDDLCRKKVSIGDKLILLTRADQQKGLSELEKNFRKDTYYQKIAEAPLEVILVKIADRMCNLLNYIYDLEPKYTLKKFPNKFNETIKGHL